MAVVKLSVLKLNKNGNSTASVNVFGKIEKYKMSSNSAGVSVAVTSTVKGGAPGSQWA